MAAGHAPLFSAFAEAMREVGPTAREQLYFQMHFGANYVSPQAEYGWTTNLDAMKHSIDWELSVLGTDYIDFGFIHCIDEASDLNQYIASGALDYVRALHERGVIHHLGPFDSQSQACESCT